MPKQVDINSAFDALLADSSPLHRGNQNSSYVNNDSDSEVSDWEKYYAKEDEDELESEESAENDTDNKEVSEKNAENGHSSKLDLVSSSKRNKRSASVISSDSSKSSSSNGSNNRHRKDHGSKSKLTKVVKNEETKKKSVVNSSSSSENYKKGKGGKTKGKSHLPHSHSTSESTEKASSPSSPGPSISKSSSPQPERNSRDHTEDHSTHSSSSSTSSGPAYMLVAVDAHGNNVPMPVLSEGGNHLVAVEASMEDGTTRTLYIDPAHLGPNVDLNNLMLHIDNSGQETVIIPTSTTDGEIISSTLVEQPVQDSESSSPVEENAQRRSSQICEDVAMNEETKEATISEKMEKYKKEENGNDAGDKNENKEVKNEEVDDVKKSEDEEIEDVKIKADKIETTEEDQMLNKNADREMIEDPEEEDLVDQEKKSEADLDLKEQLENPQSEEAIEDDEEFDELPDLTANVSRDKIFSPNDIVWVLTHGLWWPSFVLKIYSKESKASILYINCQQKTPIKVNLSRLKLFSYIDYIDIFESQENKAVGLTEAMEMAKHFRELKIKNALDHTPKEFFSLPVSEQRSIIDAKTLEMREIALAEKSVAQHPPSPENKNSPPMSPLTLHDSRSEGCSPKSPSIPQISEDCLSERDLIKLASATKARRSSNERFVKFIKSEPSLEHLRNVCSGSFSSERHNYFKLNYRNPEFLILFSGEYNTGSDFFGEEDEEQASEVMSYLFNKFETEEIVIDLDSSERKLYTSTVLYPEVNCI
ncbi:hypothetical protein Avbf_12160 [Armadillidium vulgare]|nr:hypothetical protein Avbf_12160 [Armadillidium vulgare]